jgi:tetratricopeptide (TPR) repeat protein
MSSKKRQSKQKRARQQSQLLQAQMKSIAHPRNSASGTQKILSRATQLWNELEYEKAIKQFERAHRLAPRNMDVYMDLGRAYLLHHHQDKADVIFEKVLIKTHRDITTLMRIAESYVKIPRFDLAEPYFREACIHEDAPLEALTSHADALERIHKINEADEILQKAERYAEGHPQIRLQQARILKRKKKDAEAKILLERLCARKDLPYAIQWKAFYELAKTHNLLEDYPAAMECWLSAKIILRKEGELFRPQLDKLNEETEKGLPGLTEERLSTWSQRAEHLSEKRSIAFLTGHPRSGTTLLEQILDSHSGVISSDESSIFGDEIATPITKGMSADTNITEALDLIQSSTLNTYRDRYWKYTESYVRAPIGDRTLLDKNPALTLQLPVISAAFPEAKIIFALRDPRDTVISCFMQQLYMNTISLTYLDLKTACEQYARVMNLWLHIRPSLQNPWIELRYEDLVEDTEKQARRALEFLELPWDESVLEYHKRAQEKFVSSPTYGDVTKRIYKGAVGRWKNYRQYLEPHLHILDPYIEAFGYSR